MTAFKIHFGQRGAPLGRAVAKLAIPLLLLASAGCPRGSYFASPARRAMSGGRSAVRTIEGEVFAASMAARVPFKLSGDAARRLYDVIAAGDSAAEEFKFKGAAGFAIFYSDGKADHVGVSDRFDRVSVNRNQFMVDGSAMASLLREIESTACAGDGSTRAATVPGPRDRANSQALAREEADYGKR